MPIFGKVPNVQKTDLSIPQIIKNEKFGLVISSLGCDIGDNFDIMKLKYYKIILLSDADVDGLHIVTLHLAFFYKYFKQIIEKGYLYIPKPPLFRARKKGSEDKWFYSEQEMKAENLTGWDISRFKGLGEMSEDDLWDTTMNPETRTMYRVTIEDAEKAYQAIVDCMGSDVSARKEMILNKIGDDII